MKFTPAKGFQDFFGPRAKLRQRVMNTIREVFERYNFEPLETPIMEPLEVLTAKFAAGENSDALDETYRLTDKNEKKFGLRFDLTVPLARFVSQNNRLPNPYKRYAMGSVFRDAAVDKNRYREFTQCDADIVGLGGPLYDAEVLMLANDGFKALGIEAKGFVNNRKFLVEVLDQFKIKKEWQENVLIAVDKLDKVSKTDIQKELTQLGLSSTTAAELIESFMGSGKSVDAFLKKYPNSVGLKEIKEVMTICQAQGLTLSFSPSLVRGLAYYTGSIFEFKDTSGKINGSIGGGGRYDNMIGAYAGNDKIVPAVGISFGLERILDLLELQGSNLTKSTLDYYVVPVGVEPAKCLSVLQALRQKGYVADMDLEKRSVSKGLENANKKGATFAVMVGEDELMQCELTIKNLKTGTQEKSTLNHIAEKKL